MPTTTDFDMRHQLRGIGIVHVDEQDRVIDVARKCATTGLAVGSGWAILGAPALAPGALAGFLSGFAAGTATCVGLSLAARQAVKELGSGTLESP